MSRDQDLYFGYRRLQEIAYKNNTRAYTFKDGKYLSNLALSRTVIDVIIDVSWLEKFEECMPYVENCVNEFRSFIKNEDEIMLIQLSNKIDVSKTLTYMTQHVDSIIEYDEIEDSITPGKLVNTVYENTYDIYENRFLYTLLMRCADFLGDLYRDVEKISTKNFINISFDYDKEDRSSEVNNDMRLSIVFDKSEKQKSDKKVQLDKISRLVAIQEKLNELMGSDLIKNLKKCKEVNDPLTMTNVLQKNPNFVKAVVLWNFLTTYDGKKVEIIENDRNIAVNPTAKENFYELSSVVNVLLRSFVDAEYTKNMDREYKKYVREEELARQQELKEKIKAAREEAVRALTQKHEKEIRELEDKLTLCKQKIEHYRKAMNSSKVQIVEDFMQELEKLYAQRRELEEKLVSKYSEDLKDEKEYLQNMYKQYVVEADQRIKQEKDSYALKLKQAKEEFRQAMNAADKKHREEIAKLNFIHDAQMQELEARYDEKIAKIINDKNLELEKQKSSYEEKIDSINLNHSEEIKELKEKHRIELEEMIRAHMDEMEELEKKHQKELAYVKDYYEEQLEQLEEEHEEELERLANEHEEEIYTLELRHAGDIDEIKRRYEEDADRRSREHLQELEDVRVQCDGTVRMLKASHETELHDKEREFRSEIDMLTKKHVGELSDVRAANGKAMADLAADRDKSIKAMEHEHKLQLAALNKSGEKTKSDLEREIKKLKIQLNNERKDHKKELKRTVRTLNSKHESEMEELLRKQKKRTPQADADTKEEK